MREIKYSPSINIVRDIDKEYNYVPTPNTQRICDQIIEGFNTSMHSYSLIGSYGSGKSSFFWALERNLLKKKNYFFELNGQFNGFDKFEIINIVGSYYSLQEALGKELDSKSINAESIIYSLEEKYQQCYSNKKFLVIIIDEFGKFLEYASQNNPEQNVYFLQQLSEYVNDPDKNILLITSLHQNFLAYASKLTIEQKQEWEKVKGRFIELAFNEPIEQLLYLASQRIRDWELPKIPKQKINRIFSLVKEKDLLPKNSEYKNDFAQALFPFDILTAIITTKALQQYGQNERSLFTFLERRGDNSLYKYGQNNKFFNLLVAYDFLIENFYTYLNDRHNPDKHVWDSIRKSIHRVESVFDDKLSHVAKAIIKTIGLTTLFGETAGKIDKVLIETYLNRVLGYEKPKIEQAIETLISSSIIRYRQFSKRYILFEGTDLDFDKAIMDAAEIVTPVKNVAAYIEKRYNLPYIQAKQESYEKGTPRFFKFLVSDKLEEKVLEDEIDGYINLILSEKITLEEVQEHSKDLDEAIVYIYFTKIKEIRAIIDDLERIDYVINKQIEEGDFVAANELKNIKTAELNKLNSFILESIYSGESSTTWVFDGNIEEIGSEREANQLLSHVCRTIYHSTPVFRNELVNKHRISSAISTAKKSLFSRLLNYSEFENLGFPENKFPPEKTIYLSLLLSNGMHEIYDGKYCLKEPSNESFSALWEISMKFLESSIDEEKPITEFYSILSKKPFKLKAGFIGFWVPLFLLMKKTDFAIFNNGNYLPYLTEETLELINRTPEVFSIRSYAVSELKINLHNEYRKLLRLKSMDSYSGDSFLETIKPFILFYRDLPDYTRNTINLSDHAKNLRNAIANMSDPYSAFFIDFPAALGYTDFEEDLRDSNLEQYVNSLRETIGELKGCYNNLRERIENRLLRVIRFEEEDKSQYPSYLKERYSDINIEDLHVRVRNVLKRIRAVYDSKEKFIESLSSVLLNKSLGQISDKEETILGNSIEQVIKTLDRLLLIHAKRGNNKSELAFSVDIVDSSGNEKSLPVILNNNDLKELNKIKKEIESKVNLDSVELKQALYAMLLKELVK